MKQFSLFFVCLGIALLAFSSISYKRRSKARSRFYQTVGTVIDKRVEHTPDNTITTPAFALLTVRFITVLGQALDFIVQSSQGNLLEIGDQVRIFYDPTQPELATLSVTPNALSLLAISSMIGGIACLLIGMFFFMASQG